MPMENEIENARRDALVKKEYEDYEKQLKKEREENEAPRKAVRESLLDFGFKIMGKDRAKSEPLPGKPSDKDKKPENLPGKGKTEKLGEGMKKYASGGKVSSASARADGIAQRGKTKGRIC